LNKLRRLRRHSRENGNLEVFEIPGFRVALAIASLPGMTIKLCHELWFQDTKSSIMDSRTNWLLLLNAALGSFLAETPREILSLNDKGRKCLAFH
jgi:hypothetical protein